MQDFDYQRPPPPAPPPPPPPPRRPLALFFLLAMLVVVTSAPFLVERVQYASTRGKLRARSDTANEELNELREKAGLVSLADTSHVFNLVARKVEPCVVHIDVEQLPGSRPDEIVLRIPGRGAPITQGQGSGFIVDTEGHIVTNRHVIEGATAIRVNLADGRTIEDVAIVGDDEATDLAVLKISASDLSVATWGDSDKLDVGDWVLAVGNPYGLDRTVTSGIVSATQRRKIAQSSSIQDFLQTDAAVNPGNSGGPLVNMFGEVIGVTTAIVGRSYQGISFAIPSEVARHSFDQIIKNGHVERGYLGVGFQDLDSKLAARLGLPKDQGALVAVVQQGSPADAAGIQEGDVILEWNDREIIDPTDLALAVAGTEIGSMAKLVIWRDGERKTIEAKVGRKTEQPRMRRR